MWFSRKLTEKEVERKANLEKLVLNTCFTLSYTRLSAKVTYGVEQWDINMAKTIADIFNSDRLISSVTISVSGVPVKWISRHEVGF